MIFKSLINVNYSDKMFIDKKVVNLIFYIILPYSRALILNSLCHIIIKTKNQSFFIDEYFLEELKNIKSFYEYKIISLDLILILHKERVLKNIFYIPYKNFFT